MSFSHATVDNFHLKVVRAKSSVNAAHPIAIILGDAVYSK